jgi:hypothetical protein
VRREALDACEALTGERSWSVSEAEDEYATANLGDAEVCGVQDAHENAIGEPRCRLAQTLDNVAQVWCICGGCKSGHILEHEHLWLDLTHYLVEMSE